MKNHCEENENIPFFSVHFTVPHDFLTLYNTILTFNDPEKESLENIVTKRENAGYQHFAPFPTIISTLAQTNFNFSVKFILSSPNAFNFVKFKNLSLGLKLINI